MNKKVGKFNFKRFFAILVVVAIMVTGNLLIALAAEEVPQVRMNAKNNVTFSNIDNLDVGETMEFDIVDSEGNPAKVGIERVSRQNRAGALEWKVYYTGVVVNAHFYMIVDNNKVTSVYDDTILVIGGTFSDDSLTRTSTYGKLTFNVESVAGVLAKKCWLKGTVTGEGNLINVDWNM